MNISLSRRGLLRGAISSAFVAGSSIPANAFAKAYFPVFDALLFTNKPAPMALGMTATRLAYQNDLWPNGTNRSVVPSSAAIQEFLQKTAGMGDMLILDIEADWPLYGVSQPIELASITRYQTVGNLVHNIAPAMNTGIYATVPHRDYARAISGPASTGYKQWQAENTGGAPAAQTMNTLYPSIYTFYKDQAGWVKYATANISEAKRLANGKPVIPFLWPQYHNSTPLAYQFIDPDYWKLQLETCYQLADGVVLWGGQSLTGGSIAWNSKALWWIVTQNFLNSINNWPPVRAI